MLSTTASGYTGAGINAAGIAAILNGGNPFLGTFGGAVNIVYGQDTAVGPIVLDVGSGTPNHIVSDALKNNTANGWGNAALIAQGTFTTASRPAFIPSGANSTDANVLPVGATTTAPQNASLDATTTTVVRGDSVSTLGLGDNLRRGDHTRDFAVNGSDLDIVLARFNQAVAAANAWDLGDNTNDNQVNGSDLDNVLAGFNTTQTPPSVGAASNVPEPGSLVMLALSGGMLALFRRR